MEGLQCRRDGERETERDCKEEKRGEEKRRDEDETRKKGESEAPATLGKATGST